MSQQKREIKPAAKVLLDRLKLYRSKKQDKIFLKYQLADFLVCLIEDEVEVTTVTTETLSTKITQKQKKAFFDAQEELSIYSRYRCSPEEKAEIMESKTLGDIWKKLLRRRNRLAFFRSEYASEAADFFPEFLEAICQQEVDPKRVEKGKKMAAKSKKKLVEEATKPKKKKKRQQILQGVKDRGVQLPGLGANGN